MVLQALKSYYDVLAADPQSEIAPPGYSIANVSLALNLSPDGQLLDILPLVIREQRGKKVVELPLRKLVPEQVKRASGISPNFLCDNSAYVLGISGKEAADPDYAARRFEAFRKWNTDLLAGATGPAALAVTAFLNTHDPLSATASPVIAAHWDDLIKGGFLVFRLDGGGFIHEDEEIRRIWDLYKAEGSKEYVGQCLVTGEVGPVARLHPSLKGIVDANSTGATLVGFNARAYESYNRTQGQGLNSPVGEKAAFAYTTVLNYLLSRDNPNRKFILGDATVVYWAQSSNPSYADLFSSFLAPDNYDYQPEANSATPGQDKQAEQRLTEIANKIKRGEALDTSAMFEGLNPDTHFYILGLAPNAARVAVRFFHQDTFSKVVRQIMAHYVDLQIEKEFENQPTWISVRQILDETVSKKASDKKVSPLMAGAVLRSILGNIPYPAALYYAVITRIRADADDKAKRISKINYVRAAIIKAYLTRKYRNQNQSQIQEVLCMSLNEQSTLPAYLLGRLFAVLEKVQMEAIPGANATIKDRYFTSACASPASVFPVLLRLSQHHISKAEYGYASDKKIEQIMNLLDVNNHPFPAHLSLDEQGIFVLGYYHQRAAFYVSKADKNSAESTSSEIQ